MALVELFWGWVSFFQRDGKARREMERFVEFKSDRGS